MFFEFLLFVFSLFEFEAFFGAIFEFFAVIFFQLLDDIFINGVDHVEDFVSFLFESLNERRVGDCLSGFTSNEEDVLLSFLKNIKNKYIPSFCSRNLSRRFILPQIYLSDISNIQPTWLCWRSPRGYLISSFWRIVRWISWNLRRFRKFPITFQELSWWYSFWSISRS